MEITHVRIKHNQTSPDEFTVAITPSVDRRVRYLRNLQHDHAKLQAEFRQEYHAMEMKWAAKFTALFEKRAACVGGEYEPTDAEAKWDFDEEEVDEDGNKVEKPALAAEDSNAPTKGIPNFWLAALLRDSTVQNAIEEHDIPVLKHLKDVKCELFDGEKKGFKLSFVFEKNEYFTNDVLSKTFDCNFEVEDDCQMFDFETVSGAAGTVITWNEDKSTCEKKIKKKQRKKAGKGAGKTRTVFKSVPQRSFFHIFDEGDWEEAEEEEEGGEGQDNEPVVDAMLFGEAATQIKEEVIPNALLFALGENEEYDEYDDYDGEDGDEYDDEDEDAPAIEEIHDEDEEEEEEEPKPKGKGGKGGRGGGHGHSHGPGGHGHSHGPGGHAHGPAGGDKAPECKQS